MSEASGRRTSFVADYLALLWWGTLAGLALTAMILGPLYLLLWIIR